METKAFITKIINELEHVKETIEEQDCADLINAVQKSRKVFCYGLGRAGFSMRAFTMRLMHMGKEVYFLTETITPNFGADDLFIVSSASGETAQLIALAKKARELGGVVAVLTTNRHSSITEFCDVTVQINAPSKNQKQSTFSSAQPMASLYEQALLIIADALVMKMAADSSSPEEELFKRHATLE
ncbi:6-phospho-3-hexuloisomerase [Klebsiella pneumoniae]|uniref:6-phospho-3-hexuloisomerase n=1 Tax=Klebsiella pneumoniae TaxID=573 RepID=UPI0005B40E78|nr:6-phospho-3-hexuloisomerase [Klebsiella pneumoniae]